MSLFKKGNKDSQGLQLREKAVFTHASQLSQVQWIPTSKALWACYTSGESIFHGLCFAVVVLAWDLR